ncbi:hypothetical protein HYALB_00002494 [Hymenoscyphus albidus]|uniref:Zn(2)-C6 fungal-type domain-containing protein n=1 Tax=Hymenoscyphus albidus TaxID=595503 RepID=A0A9N9LT42_9HELO|nr:hypothetical protein HYALB_00002494 [Hymenoscyphus albidus]
MKPKSGNRFRVCGTPSKTGCITCKIRRVKCGEEHPFCKRCTSTGRKCDGYAPQKVPDPSSRKASSMPPSRNHRDASSSIAEDPMEQHLLYLFRTVTAPKLSGYFSADFWQRRIFHASTVEPSVQHAVIAIAAIHQDYVNWQRRKISDPSMQAFAFRQYIKAISFLHILMSTQSQQLDMTLIACICFITFDCLLGNHESAIIHLQAGLKILEDIRSRKSQHHDSTIEQQWEAEFAPLLLSLGTQAASFVNPNHQVYRSALWISLRKAAIHNRSNSFRSIDEARHALDTLAADITVERKSCATQFPDLLSLNTRRFSSATQLNAIRYWKRGLDNLLVDTATSDPDTMSRTNLGASLLKLHALVYSIVIDTSAASEERFEEVLAHCEYLINSRSIDENLNFTPDMGIISPLFFTILRSHTISIQRRAMDLLSQAEGREGMWDTQDALRIAKGALEAAGHTEWEDYGSVTATSVPQSESRPRAGVMDRMIWPFGERWEISVSSAHSTPQLEYSLPFSSNQNTPHSATEPTFSSHHIPPQLKTDSGFGSSTGSVPHMGNESMFPSMLHPTYDWPCFE